MYKMKIIHIVRQFYPCIGGVENFVLNLARQQIESGHEVSVVTLNRNFVDGTVLDDKEVVDGIKINRIPFMGSKKYPLAFSCLKYLKGVDIVHIHCVDFFIDCLAFAKIFHRKKIVLHTHGGFFHTKWMLTLKKIFFHIVTRLAFTQVDAVIACSRSDYDMFKPLTKKLYLVYNGVDVERFSSVELSLVPERMLYVGRIDAHKRIDNLIRILAELRKLGKKVTLSIVGPDWIGLRDDLERLAEKLGVLEYVYFIGRVSDEEMLNEVSKAYVFVSASEYEGFGISVVEAMSAGLPCVINDIVPFRTFEKKANGACVITDFSNLIETSKKISDFFGYSKEKYLEFSAMAQKMSKEFSWPTVASKIENIYTCIKE